MTVTVTLPDGGADEYMPFGDTGAKESYQYESGGWTNVAGDEKSWKKGFFRR